MPKMKTHRGTAKRIKVTSTGKLLRRHANKGHFLSKKSASRKRTFGKDLDIPAVSAQSIRRKLGGL